MTQSTKCKAVDPKTGLTLREATEEETRAYLEQECRGPAFRIPVKMNDDVLIDVDAGPGVWFGGAGF